VYSAFQYLATGDNFQQGFRDAIRPGIYSGGTVSIVAANQVQISNMRVVFRSTDISANKVTHISFNTPVILNTPNAPNGDYTLYLTYGYLANLNNFADFGIRLTSAPAIPDEVRIGRVVNDGAGAATSIFYTNRTRGTIDTDNNDELTTDIDPTQDWHVGNRAYNDLRYVNQNGPNTWDIQVLKTTDGSLGTSRVWFQGTAAREWELQDRSMVLADNRAAFQLGDIKSTIATITPTDLTPWLDISVDYVTLNASGAGSWPLLVPHLRGLSGGTGYVVNGYAPGVSTVLQMDSGDPATAAFVLALYEDNLYHGGNVENYANYKTITVSTAFGTDIPVGEYNILDIDPIAYTIEIDASTSGPSALGTIDHYPFRIKSSTTTARWFKVNDSVLATSSTETPLLYRVRDRSQKHKHLDNGHIHGGVYAALALALGTIIGALFGVTGSPTANTYGGAADIGEAVDSGTGAGTPRTGNTTRARGFAVNKYIYGVIYQP
jgi:hypothetical protein